MSEFDPPAIIKFNEPLYVYDYLSDSWLSKECIAFNYKNVNPNIISDKSLSRSSNGGATIEDITKFYVEVHTPNKPYEDVIQSDMHLNHIYEIHHYDREIFLASQHLRDSRIGKNHTPRYIISITVEKEDLRNNGFYFTKDSFFRASQFDLFLEEKNEEIPEAKTYETEGIYLGCDFNLKETAHTWETLIAKLYKEFRYSYSGLLDQMQIRFSKLIIKCFKDILRFLAKVHGAEEQATSLHLISYFVKNGLRMNKFADLIDLETEFLNIVYKCLISEGLLPIFIDLNTMNSGWCNTVQQFIFNKMCCMFLSHEEILPWSPKFHASITILDRYYSYTPNNLMNQRNEKDRILHDDFDYYRIKVLDFFPLDDWVHKISDFLLHGFDSILDEISILYTSKILKVYDKNESEDTEENVALSELHGYEQIIDNSKKPLLGNNMKKKPLKHDNAEIWIEYDNYKKDKKEKKDPIYLVLIKAMNNLKNSKESNFDKLSNKSETLPQSLANYFMSNYSYELLQTKFFENFCLLISKTEMKKYSFFNQNCQTIVGEIVHDLHEQLKRYIDILLPMKDFIQPKDERIYKYYLKFHSKETNIKFFDRFGFIQPCFFNARLDYYGIYVDKYLKKKIEKWIKNREIKSKKNEKIEKIQKEFSKCFKELFMEEEKKEVIFLENLEKRKSLIYEPPNFSFSVNRKVSKIGDVSLPTGDKLTSISDCLSSLMFNMQIGLLEIRKKLISYKLHKSGKFASESKIRELNKIKYERRDLQREFSYYYFNAIRLQNSFNENKNYFSYIGFILIKDPEQLLNSKPENFKRNYELF